jgi:hypothetical protein
MSLLVERGHGYNEGTLKYRVTEGKEETSILIVCKDVTLPSLRVKLPRRGANNPAQSNTNFKERVELHLCPYLGLRFVF